MKKRVRFTESQFRSLVGKCVKRALNEAKKNKHVQRLNESQILDNLCLQVEPGRYGEFWIRDTESWLEFVADAYIYKDILEIEVESDCNDTRADQLCNSEIFVNLCKSAILSDSPQNIRGFQDFVDDLGSWNEAIEELESQLEYEADTIEKKTARIKRNMKASSPDFYSAKYGW